MKNDYNRAQVYLISYQILSY